jgi:hypothetical protein
MAAILNQMKRGVFRLSIRISAPAIVRQLHRGILRRAPQAHELSACVESIRKSGRIGPVLKRLLKSEELRCTVSRIKIIKPAAEDGIPEQHANGLPISAPPEPELSPVFKSSVRTAKPSRNSGRLIVVSSNCQTGGLAAALQVCLAKDTIIPLPLPASEDVATMENFIDKLGHVDIWISLRELEWAKKFGFKERSGFQFLRVPSIDFRAFHPDLCYARSVLDGRFTTDNYNSAIAAWAYNNGMEVRDTTKLFNRDTYARLGYFNLWEPNLHALRSEFNACGLDFPRYMLAVKRTGLFMHSINHPMVHAINELAKSLALKMGAPDCLSEWDIKLGDSLISDAVWPLYPEIADHYSLPGGSYDWRLRGIWRRGLDAYIDHVFREYESQQISRNGLEILNRDEAFHAQVLGPLAGISR